MKLSRSLLLFLSAYAGKKKKNKERPTDFEINEGLTCKEEHMEFLTDMKPNVKIVRTENDKDAKIFHLECDKKGNDLFRFFLNYSLAKKNSSRRTIC